MLTRFLAHRGGEIDASRMAADFRERRDHQPRPARDIEHRIIRLRPGKLDEEPQRLLVAHRRRVGEGRRLTRELIEDDIGVRGHLNWRLMLAPGLSYQVGTPTQIMDGRHVARPNQRTSFFRIYHQYRYAR